MIEDKVKLLRLRQSSSALPPAKAREITGIAENHILDPYWFPVVGTIFLPFGCYIRRKIIAVCLESWSSVPIQIPGFLDVNANASRQRPPRSRPKQG